MDDAAALAILARENIRVSRDWVIILPPLGTPRRAELNEMVDVVDAVTELLYEWDFDYWSAHDSASWTGRRTYVHSDASPWASFKRWFLKLLPRDPVEIDDLFPKE